MIETQDQLGGAGVVRRLGAEHAQDRGGQERGWRSFAGNVTDDRLIACVNQHRALSPQGALEALLAEVRAFCADATQSDDVTAVFVRYNG